MGSPVNQNDNLDSPTVLLRRLHHWRMAFFGLVILIAGITTGAAATFLVLHFTGPELSEPQPGFDDEMVFHIGRRLHLSAEQTEQVRTILRKHWQQLDEIRQEGRSQIVRQLRLMNEEMATVLDKNQEQQWQTMLRDLPGPFRPGARGYGPGPGPGPGGRFGARRGGGPGQYRASPNDLRTPRNGTTPVEP